MAESTAKKPVTKKTNAKKTASKSTAKKSVAKKSTSAKTCTKSTSSKKPVGKSSSKKVAKPAVSDSNKASEVSTLDNTSKSRLKTLSPIDKIKSMLYSNVFLGVVLAVLSVFYVKSHKIDLILNYQVKDNFIVNQPTSLTPGVDFLWAIDIKYLLATVLGLTAISSLLLSTVLFKRYEESIKSSVSSLRWILFGLVNAVMIEVVSFMSGVQDLSTLKLVGLMVVMASVFGWLAERENKDVKGVKVVGMWAFVLSLLLAHLPIFISLVSTTLIAGERFSWYVYALVATLVLFWASNVVNMRRSFYLKDKYQYVTFENWYVRIDQVAKVLITFIIFVAFISK